MKRIILLAIFIISSATAACAQDIVGDWQGTLNAGGSQSRLILQLTKTDDGRLKGVLFSIDRGTQLDASTVTFENGHLKFILDRTLATFEGQLSADGKMFSGTFTQGAAIPLELKRATKETAWSKDPSPHTVQFITVDKDVKLEVLDWGGTGRPLIFLTGLGDNAHVYDKFATKFTITHHVYAITRRGFQPSSIPQTGYSADRLGDDVLAVMDALKITKPVLIGHSIGGEELSSIGSRYPDKVSGLVYLDAGYSYAYYNSEVGDLNIDMGEVQKKLDQLVPGRRSQDPRPLLRELLETNLPALERDLKQLQKNLDDNPPPPAPARGGAPQIPVSVPGIFAGAQKYIEIKVPILAIFALPHDFGQVPAAAKAAQEAADASAEAQAKAFEKGLPSAHVVRIPHAQHYVYRSNEADVIKEMDAFLAGLP